MDPPRPARRPKSILLFIGSCQDKVCSECSHSHSKFAIRVVGAASRHSGSARELICVLRGRGLAPPAHSVINQGRRWVYACTHSARGLARASTQRSRAKRSCFQRADDPLRSSLGPLLSHCGGELGVERPRGAEPHGDDHEEAAGEVGRRRGERADAEDHGLLEERPARLAQRVAYS